MIDNNTLEDIEATQKAGLSTYLLIDCLIRKGKKRLIVRKALLKNC